jgi:hypothetical protein
VASRGGQYVMEGEEMVVQDFLFLKKIYIFFIQLFIGFYTTLELPWSSPIYMAPPLGSVYK